MKRGLYLVAILCCIGLSTADAAVRSATTNTLRTPNTQSTTRSITKKTTTRAANTNTVRTAINGTTARKTTNARTARTARSAVRSATIAPEHRSASVSRAATTTAISTKTFDSGYNTCHDAYFTCMDQFCANQDDSYRRCVCSSRLSEIQSRERALDETSDSLENFKNLNIDIIKKTEPEVKAMLSGTQGEVAAANAKDTSDSANKLAGISAILSNTKSKSLSTSGSVDIGGNINEIWATTDLTSGANIANLTGEQLYNAVHTQCAAFVSDQCASNSILNMVISAYGMYIENDCALLSAKLDKSKNAANKAIRETEREMNYARLENYNAHNSESINNCIAQVRSDITQDSACGTDYIHCIDVTGLYLNSITGEPIYTSKFYQLETQISLSGDILTNQQNRLIVATLNNKKDFAKNTLDKCSDLSADVWSEFMRQAITEIYQAQQDRIRQVKSECLDVVNTCYDEQNASLKDFSNIDEELLLGSRLELAEEMCQEKLTTCSNLYGGGPEGMIALVSAMRKINDQRIESACLTNLKNYVKNICTVSAIDTLHKYPYGCRTYAPGEYKDAIITACNRNLVKESLDPGELPDSTKIYNNIFGNCTKQYTDCHTGYYKYNNYCYACPENCTQCVYNNNELSCTECSSEGLDRTNNCTTTSSEALKQCDDDYFGSLYQKLVRYAMQVCVRPSETGESDTKLPNTVMEDIVAVMSDVRIEMGNELAAECERQGGQWISTPQTTEPIDANETFDTETNTSRLWGYCRNNQTTTTTLQSIQELIKTNNEFSIQKWNSISEKLNEQQRALDKQTTPMARD